DQPHGGRRARDRRARRRDRDRRHPPLPRHRPSGKRARGGSRAADRQRGGRRRYLRQPGRPGAALLPGEARARNGAPGLVGPVRAAGPGGRCRALRQRRRGVRRARGLHGRLPGPVLRRARRRRPGDHRDGGSARVPFVLAPAISFTPALLTFAVIPFAAPLPTRWGDVPMVVADLPVGFLYILAISSLGVYGVTLAGWSSNNKYALLGGLRASAQMISYEIAMGMSTVAVLLLAGNVTLSRVIAQQQAGGWYVLSLLLAFFIFLVSAFAETNRVPFDLPEAEGELIAGYHTEYSAMKFSMF